MTGMGLSQDAEVSSESVLTKQPYALVFPCDAPGYALYREPDDDDLAGPGGRNGKTVFSRMMRDTRVWCERGYVTVIRFRKAHNHAIYAWDGESKFIDALDYMDRDLYKGYLAAMIDGGPYPGLVVEMVVFDPENLAHHVLYAEVAS